MIDKMKYISIREKIAPEPCFLYRKFKNFQFVGRIEEINQSETLMLDLNIPLNCTFNYFRCKPYDSIFLKCFNRFFSSGKQCPVVFNLEIEQVFTRKESE